MTVPSQRRPLFSKEEETAERAARAREPDWDVDEIEQATLEVDQTLIRWSMGLSIRGRLRAATRAARMLGRFRVSTPCAG